MEILIAIAKIVFDKGWEDPTAQRLMSAARKLMGVDANYDVVCEILFQHMIYDKNWRKEKE